MRTDPRLEHSCETYADWLRRVLAAGDIDELRRGRVR
jgi:hypothetical protein